MKSIACMPVGSLLSKRASGLTDAERLRLEEHLQRCASCRSDAHALDTLTALSRSPELPSLTSRARDRAIASALMQANQQPDSLPVAPRTWWPRLAWAGTAVAAAAAVVLSLTIGGEDQAAKSSTHDDAALVVAGDIAADGQQIETGARVALNAEMTSSRGARLILGRAEVEVAPSSTIAWEPSSETLSLRSGSLRASVEPDPSRTFRVSTDAFTVEVVGTEFRVTPDRVEVFDGTVRIVDNRGGVVVAALTEGKEWQAGVATATKRKKKRARKRPRKRTKPAAEPEVDVSELLADARSHLASKSVEGAKGAIQSALDAEPNRRQQAEAYSLIAECALVSGERAKAARLYLQVATKYRGLRAAENALFAAARIEANDGNHAAAKQHLERYLERYPDGRFRDEAERRLSDIE